MCGIAGIVDLDDRRPTDADALRRMADALTHRGPDEDGFLVEPGVGLASRRLSIVGLDNGRQPVANEDGSVAAVFNGELFDHPERRLSLEKRGHAFRTATDGELLPHLWEEYGDDFLGHVKGQFAFALYDRRGGTVVLARDRFGICPLFWTVRDGRLLFASEIKALLASGMVPARPDHAGLNHVFMFFGVPGPTTCFEGVSLLLPGRFIKIKVGESMRPPRAYWQVEYPDHGDERRADPDEFEERLTAAVRKRLRADVPVVSYLSGGVDSGSVLALANKALGRPVPAFTIAIDADGLDEQHEAAGVARALGSELTVVRCGRGELRDAYPELINAAEAPVIDTSCAALMLLARRVNEHGYKVALTGEGADEWLAGYRWFKTQRALKALDAIPGLPVTRWLRSAFLKVTGQPRYPKDIYRRAERAVGGYNGWLDLYGLMGLSRLRFFSPDRLKEIEGKVVFEEIELNPNLHRWHPFHRTLYLGARVHLAGHLLAAKGDRVAMNSSVETRYPFLDEDFVGYVNGLHPRWKLRGLSRDKYLLRQAAKRWLPKEAAGRRKGMFRAPLDSFGLGDATPPGWVGDVMSRESLQSTGYFDADRVFAWRERLPSIKSPLTRKAVELGLAGVTATQLWHHRFIAPLG